MDDNLYKEDDILYERDILSTKESKEKEKNDEIELESISLFYSYLNNLKTFDDAGDFINETRIYEDILQLFNEDRPFPYKYYEDNKFILFLSNYIKSLTELEDFSLFLLPIHLSYIIVHQSLRLAEIFIHSDIIPIFNSVIYEDILFIDLVSLFGYLLSKTKEMKAPLINFNDYSRIFDMIENYLAVNNILEAESSLTMSFVVFFTNIISKLKEDEYGIGISNSISDFFMSLFIPDVKEEVLIAVIEGIIVGITNFSNLIGLICQYDFIPKFIAIAQEYSSDNSEYSNKVMIMLSKLFLKISLMPPTDFGLLDDCMNETEGFYPVFFSCCLHDNQDVAKRFFETVSNFISCKVILPETLINYDFNSILSTALIEGTNLIKKNGIYCILAIATVSNPNEVSELITPNIMSYLATEIDSLLSGDELYFVTCLDLILQKLSVLGHLDEVIDILQKDELFTYLQELDEETDDSDLKLKIHSVATILNFYQEEEDH